MTRVAGDHDPPRHWKLLLGEMESGETLTIVGCPFSMNFNDVFLKDWIAVILTTHRLILGSAKAGMFGGPKVTCRRTIRLASVTDNIGTYSRPYAGGALMYGIDGQTPEGSFDAYFNTMEEQDTIFQLLQGNLALRAWGVSGEAEDVGR